MILDFLRSLFGWFKGRQYSSLEKYLQGKIIPSSSEGSVRSQLMNLSSKVSEKSRKGYLAYVESEEWKDVFVKKQ